MIWLCWDVKLLVYKEKSRGDKIRPWRVKGQCHHQNQSVYKWLDTWDVSKLLSLCTHHKVSLWYGGSRLPTCRFVNQGFALHVKYYCLFVLQMLLDSPGRHSARLVLFLRATLWRSHVSVMPTLLRGATPGTEMTVGRYLLHFTSFSFYFIALFV